MTTTSPTQPAPQATPAELRWWVGNSLTIFRLVAGLIYPLVPGALRIPLILFAGISDAIDGWLARRLNAVSLVGKVLDPIADKLCVLAILGTALWEEQVTVGELVLVGARDLLVIGVVLIALCTRPESWKEMPPRLLGKLATAGQFLFLLLLVCWQFHPWPLILIVGAISLAAGLDYLVTALRYFRYTRPVPADAASSSKTSN